MGRYAVPQMGTCVSTGKKVIGDGFYLSTGAKVLNDVNMGDNVSVGDNAVVNKDIGCSDALADGNQAHIKEKSEAWYIRDGKEYNRRVALCEERKRQIPRLG